MIGAAVALVALATLLPGTSFISQQEETEEPVKMDDLPPPLKKTVLEVSKGVKLRELTPEVENGQTFYEAELDVNGRTEGGKIELVETLTRNSKIEAYEAHVKKGSKEIEFKVDPAGQLIVEGNPAKATGEEEDEDTDGDEDEDKGRTKGGTNPQRGGDTRAPAPGSLDWTHS